MKNRCNPVSFCAKLQLIGDFSKKEAERDVKMD